MKMCLDGKVWDGIHSEMEGRFHYTQAQWPIHLLGHSHKANKDGILWYL